MTASKLPNLLSPNGGPPKAPLVEVYVSLIPGRGLHVRADRCEGDVPLLEFITGYARLLIGFDVADVRQFGAEHVALAEQFATAAAMLRDETRALVAGR